MKVTEELIITELSLDGFKLKVPKGLSELLNSSGAWEYIEPGASNEDDDYLENYDRKVVMEEGRVRIYLTYKENSVTTKKKIS